VNPSDHHSEYLAAAVAALTPAGRERADELLDELAASSGHHEAVARFAMAREAEADTGRTPGAAGDEPALTAEELDVLLSGFKQIRDEEPLDDVGDWANAVVALLEDERR
jgi:hypothetical protein